MKSLLIDDDPFTLKLLTRELQYVASVEAVPCARADDAVQMLEADSGKFELVICDLQMPGMDGVEFVRHLGRIGYRGELVLISGEGRRILRTVQMLAREHGINVAAALTKPVSSEQLRQVLASHASGRASASRASRQAYAADEVERAIANGELLNHYQPKVDMASGRLIGVEALVRWQHPRDGLVYPDQFIATAEEHGLIDALTRTVLAEAPRQARQWSREGLTLQMAVNVSMDNLDALDFPEVVTQMTEDAGVAPSGLTLEVTESRLMRSQLKPLDVLSRLRLKGISLSIDDFGMGHSSLTQLRDIPFNELKLDRSFVNGAANDALLGTIVEATLGMVRGLGMKAVAEGVEDQDDWSFLRRLGCDTAQGYFIGRPMAGAEIPRWRARWALRLEEQWAGAS